jgi:hypothetical protein
LRSCYYHMPRRALSRKKKKKRCQFTYLSPSLHLPSAFLMLSLGRRRVPRQGMPQQSGCDWAIGFNKKKQGSTPPQRPETRPPAAGVHIAAPSRKAKNRDFGHGGVGSCATDFELPAASDVTSPSQHILVRTYSVDARKSFKFWHVIVRDHSCGITTA